MLYRARASIGEAGHVVRMLCLREHKLSHFCRRNSNRRKDCRTTKGTKQATRTVHALTRFHGPSLTKNRIIQRIVRRSADRRLRRFDKEGRKQKVLMKWSKDPGAEQQVTVQVNTTDMTSEVGMEASSVAIAVQNVAKKSQNRQSQGMSARQKTIQKKASKVAKLDSLKRKGKKPQMK